MNYLIIRTIDALGDYVSMEPVISLAREMIEPEDQLWVQMGSSFKGLYANHPSIDKILSEEEIPKNCEVILDMRSYWDCPIISALQQKKGKTVNATDEMIQAASVFGRQLKDDGRSPKLYLSEDEKQKISFIRNSFIRNSFDSLPMVAVQMQGSSWWKKYPYMKKLIQSLLKIAHVFCIHSHPVSYPKGALPLFSLGMREMMVWLSAMDLVIGHDSGITHLSAALEVPTYGIFGPTDPQIILKRYKNVFWNQFPIRCPRKRCGIQPCKSLACIRAVSPSAIMADVKKLLKKSIVIDLHTECEDRGLGDIIMTTPAIRALKKKYKSPIYVIARKEAHPLLKGNPNIDAVFNTIDELPRNNRKKLIQIKQNLEDYSDARNRQNRINSILEFCGCSTRNKKTEIPEILISKETKEIRMPDFCNIGVSITSNSPAREWPLEYLIELQNICTDCFFHLFIHPKTDRSEILDTEKHDRLKIHALPLSQLIPSVNEMDMLLTVDSFISHLGAALDKPQVTLYTTIPGQWRCSSYKKTIGIQSPVACSPCYDFQYPQPPECISQQIKPCITALTPQIVAETIDRFRRKFFLYPSWRKCLRSWWTRTEEARYRNTGHKVRPSYSLEDEKI